MLTDILIDETPHIYSDDKKCLIVYPTEVLHGKEKKSGINVSANLRNTDKIC